MTLSDWINDIRWKYFTNEKAGLIFKELMKEFQMVNKMTENKRFRIYQDLYEDFYIEDIESYNNQKLQRSYKIGNEEDVKYENVENIVDLLNEQEERIKELEKEKEFWKSDACNSMNLHSMLSFEIQKLSETKDVDSFLDFYYKYFCKSGDV